MHFRRRSRDVVAHHASDQDRTDWRGTNGDGAWARFCERKAGPPDVRCWRAIRSDAARAAFEQRGARRASRRRERSGVFAACDVVILAVKPQLMKTVLAEVRERHSARCARGFDCGRRHARSTRRGIAAGPADRPRDAQHALPDWSRREWLQPGSARHGRRTGSSSPSCSRRSASRTKCPKRSSTR